MGYISKLRKKIEPIFEEASLHYEIGIPEQQMVVALDHHAYFRNNLIQNVIAHSKATRIEINVYVIGDRVEVVVADNGRYSCTRFATYFRKTL